MKHLSVLMAALAMACVALAFPGPVHEEQLEGVFARVESDVFHEAAERISHSIDNELLDSFRQNIGKVPGNHRLIGHGWTLDGAIPKDVLKELERANPGRRNDILRWWGEESTKLVKGMEKATGLPTKQAKALAGLQWDFHLLGDRMPGNMVVDVVLSPKAVAENIEKNCKVLFKGRPEYAKAIGKSLRGALKAGGTDAEQAVRLMNALQKDIPFSEMLSRCWGRTLAKRGITILPRTAESVGTEAFLKSVKVAVPKTRATEARAKAAKGKGAKGGGAKAPGTAGKAASKGVKGASRAAKAFGVALPVVIETGFFFYEERKNKEAFARGEQTAEETQCITYANVGRHGAALALGAAGAWAGSEAGAAIGTGPAPGPGTAVGGVVGGVIGGILGGILGEIAGENAGEWVYVSKAEIAAEQGDLAAVFFLGGYHYKRITPGKDQHVQEALEYLQRAQVTKTGGYPKANVFLGQMAWDGIGQKAKKRKAVKLWRVAADLGDEDAMYLLAHAALSGEGMWQNIEKGHELMFKAASLGCELAIDDYPGTRQVYEDWLEAVGKRQEKMRAIRRQALKGSMWVLVVAVVWWIGFGVWGKRKQSARRRAGLQ